MLKKILKNNSGFTLIEVIIVIVLLSIIATTAIPRIAGFSTNERKNFIIMTGMIGKIFDDAFLKDRTTYLVIHLYDTSDESSGLYDEEDPQYNIFSRENGLSCVHYIDNEFIDCRGRMLQYQKFPDNFILEEVVLANGEVLTSGNVMIPYYRQGFSDNVIIHISSDDEKWSIRIDKHLKEPVKIQDFVTFDHMEF